VRCGAAATRKSHPLWAELNHHELACGAGRPRISDLLKSASLWWGPIFVYLLGHPEMGEYTIAAELARLGAFVVMTMSGVIVAN